MTIEVRQHILDKDKHLILIHIEVRQHILDKDNHLLHTTIEVLRHMQDKVEHLNLGGTVWHNNSGQAHQLPLNLSH